MTARSPILVGLVLLGALVLPAMGSLPPLAPRGEPFACALVLSGAGAGTAVEARLTAREAVQGRYALALRTAGSVIDQGGDFSAAAGETLTLGQATLSARPAAIDGRLEVTVAGRRVPCARAG